MDLRVVHQEGENFHAIVEGKTCIMNYSPINEDVLDFDGIYVPRELRHKGIATEIVNQALNYVKETNKKVIPTCDFVKNLIEKSPEFSNLLAEEQLETN